MNFGRRGSPIWPFILTGVFFLIPVILFSAYPVGFWSSTDNEPVGLASAINMAYRLVDFRIYPDQSMVDHPGIQFYFMSWIALAFTGYPVPLAGQDFFRAVIDHVDDYHRASVWVAAPYHEAGGGCPKGYQLKGSSSKDVDAGDDIVFHVSGI